MSQRFIIFFSLLIASFSAMADLQLRFGLYTSDKPSDMVKQFRPVLNVLEKDLALKLKKTVKIKLKITNSYEKSIQNLVNGKVDFARFGPASYVLSVQKNPKIKILVNEKNRQQKKFSGAIVVKADSGIDSLAQLAGKRFAFGNKNSTTGRYFAQFRLQENGIKAKDLATFDYLGRHDSVAALVSAGRYDAGSFKEGTLRKFEKKGVKFKILSTYPNVFKPWLARAGLDEKVFKAIQVSLLSFNDQNALQRLKRDGFVAGSDSDYKLTRMTIENNRQFFE